MNLRMYDVRMQFASYHIWRYKPERCGVGKEIGHWALAASIKTRGVVCTVRHVVDWEQQSIDDRISLDGRQFTTCRVAAKHRTKEPRNLHFSMYCP